MKDVTDWVVATRLKSAALLYWLLLNAEDYVTQHMAVLTTGMYRACVDEEAQVVKDVRIKCYLNSNTSFFQIHSILTAYMYALVFVEFNDLYYQFDTVFKSKKGKKLKKKAFCK